MTTPKYTTWAEERGLRGLQACQYSWLSIFLNIYKYSATMVSFWPLNELGNDAKTPNHPSFQNPLTLPSLKFPALTYLQRST